MSQIESVIKNLGVKRVVDLGGTEVRLACLLREEDRRTFQAEWWRGKQSSLIAVDDNGNFFLRHSGGHILHIDQQDKSEALVAKSETEFLNMIKLGW
ncbi:hypothetical protein [Microbulbifer taiwanensis]|uniref:Uncharacterized protein n=1 Tax=Microbulbifer taiwanensis TaxID=986746 RepID=A0ABW1YNE5_9GAMM|nr:hypothetical protein [Microbulbifer taiwanensis]